MKTVERYILAEFLKLLAIALAALTTVFLMIDVFENMDVFMKDIPLYDSVSFFLYKIPSIVGQTSPVAALVATIISLGIFSRHNELTAMKAGGIYLMRVLMPLLMAGMVMSVLVIFMNEYAVPASLRKMDAFKARWLGALSGSMGSQGAWFRTKNGIFNIRQIDLRKESLNGLTLYVIDRSFDATGLVESRLVFWKDGRWLAPEASVWSFTPEGAAVMKEEKDVTVDGLVAPDDLSSVDTMRRNMSMIKLWHYIRRLEAEHYVADRYRIELYGKIFFPLVNFIMVLVGIPFALFKTGRHGAVASGVGLSIVIAFSYWVVFALTKSLGQNGFITPLVAAAFPDVLFLSAGALLMGHVKQ